MIQIWNRAPMGCDFVVDFFPRTVLLLPDVDASANALDDLLSFSDHFSNH